MPPSYEDPADTRIWAFRMASKDIDFWLTRGTVGEARAQQGATEGSEGEHAQVPWLSADTGAD